MLCPYLQVEGLLRMPALAAVCCRISASHSPIQTAMLTHTLTGRIMPCMRGCASPEGPDGCCQSLPWQPNVHLAYRRCEELAASMHVLRRGPLEAAAKAPVWAAGSHHHCRGFQSGSGPAGHGPLQWHLQALPGVCLQMIRKHPSHLCGLEILVVQAQAFSRRLRDSLAVQQAFHALQLSAGVCPYT